MTEKQSDIKEDETKKSHNSSETKKSHNLSENKKSHNSSETEKSHNSSENKKSHNPSEEAHTASDDDNEIEKPHNSQRQKTDIVEIDDTKEEEDDYPNKIKDEDDSNTQSNQSDPYDHVTWEKNFLETIPESKNSQSLSSSSINKTPNNSYVYLPNENQSLSEIELSISSFPKEIYLCLIQINTLGKYSFIQVGLPTPPPPPEQKQFLLPNLRQDGNKETRKFIKLDEITIETKDTIILVVRIVTRWICFFFIVYGTFFAFKSCGFDLLTPLFFILIKYVLWIICMFEWIICPKLK